MATNIPPHNLTDTINACLRLLDEPETEIDELINILQAPDFPTGATIYGLSGVREGYKTGRGRVVMRGKTHIEPIGKNGEREAIIIDEIPYQVNKAKLVEKNRRTGARKNVGRRIRPARRIRQIRYARRYRIET